MGPDISSHQMEEYSPLLLERAPLMLEPDNVILYLLKSLTQFHQILERILNDYHFLIHECIKNLWLFHSELLRETMHSLAIWASY